MKRIVLILIIVIGFGSIIYSQNSYLNNRLSIKLGHSNTPKFWDFSNDVAVGNIRLETNYVLVNIFETGLYVGYSNFKNIEYPSIPNQTAILTSVYKSDALFYGLNTNIHLLPFIVSSEKIRIDLYVGAKLGMITMIAPENSLYKGTDLDYALLGGANYFITKKWGLYLEYGLSKRVNYTDTEPCLRYGIVVKF